MALLASLMALLGFGSARAQTSNQTPVQTPAPDQPSSSQAIQAQAPDAREPVIPTPAEAPSNDALRCPAAADSLVLAGDGLFRSRAAVRQNRLNILAIGSSSIEGVGASRVELGFVPLLQADLRQRMPGVAVNVFNRGIGGETAHETVGRMAAELAQYKPDLVIWQVGTNDVLRARPWNDVAADMATGEALLAAANVDVLLIDPQRVADDGLNDWVKGKNAPLEESARLIAVEGARIGYAVQKRFDAMAAWTQLTRGGVGPDGLHLNDQGYACWAALTAEGLATALQ